MSDLPPFPQLEAAINWQYLQGTSEKEVIAGLAKRTDKEVGAAYCLLTHVLGEDVMLDTIARIRPGISAADVLDVTEPILRVTFGSQHPEWWPKIQELHALAVEAVVRIHPRIAVASN